MHKWSEGLATWTSIDLHIYFALLPYTLPVLLHTVRHKITATNSERMKVAHRI